MNKEVSYHNGQMLRFQLRTSFVISETSTFDPHSTKLIPSKANSVQDACKPHKKSIKLLDLLMNK